MRVREVTAERRMRLTQAECERIRVDAGNKALLFLNNGKKTLMGIETIDRLAVKHRLAPVFVSQIIRGTYRARDESPTVGISYEHQRQYRAA